MEDLIMEVNEKFLEDIMDLDDPMELGALTSAYLNFARAAEIMQEVEFRNLDAWLDDETCCEDDDEYDL